MNEETKNFIKEQIEGLAGMVKAGFDHVEERFEDVEKRLDGVDSRLRNLDNRLDTVVSHERRIKRLEREAGLPAAD